MTPLAQMKRPEITTKESDEIAAMVRGRVNLLRSAGWRLSDGSRPVFQMTNNHSLQGIALGLLSVEWRDYANQLETECAERDEKIEELRETIETKDMEIANLRHSLAYRKVYEAVEKEHPTHPDLTLIVNTTINQLQKEGLLK